MKTITQQTVSPSAELKEDTKARGNEGKGENGYAKQWEKMKFSRNKPTTSVWDGAIKPENRWGVSKRRTEGS